MKIKIPKSLCEPLALRWDEMLSMEDHKNPVHNIRKTLHEMCEHGEAAGLIPRTPISMMIGMLQSVAEAAGAEDVWVEFNKYNNVDGDTILIKYRLDFALPGNPKERYGWARILPVV